MGQKASNSIRQFIIGSILAAVVLSGVMPAGSASALMSAQDTTNTAKNFIAIAGFSFCKDSFKTTIDNPQGHENDPGWYVRDGIGASSLGSENEKIVYYDNLGKSKSDDIKCAIVANITKDVLASDKSGKDFMFSLGYRDEKSGSNTIIKNDNTGSIYPRLVSQYGINKNPSSYIDGFQAIKDGKDLGTIKSVSGLPVEAIQLIFQTVVTRECGGGEPIDQGQYGNYNDKVKITLTDGSGRKDVLYPKGCRVAERYANTLTAASNEVMAMVDNDYLNTVAGKICGSDGTCIRDVIQALKQCSQSSLISAKAGIEASKDATVKCVAEKTNKKSNVILAAIDGTSNAATAAPAPASGSNQATGPKSSCSPDVGALGWIICPAMNIVAKLSDEIYKFIASILEVKSSDIFDITNQNLPAYRSWVIFRNIANVAFVIAFLVIIYSQITGAGITNYGIKKLLPKLIVTALLVNVSYYICVALVDISNLAGYGVRNMFVGLTDVMATGQRELNIAEKIGSGLAGILAAAGLGVILFLSISIPVLFAGFIALLMLMLILIARQAIIILLVVISPLAFVAFLLPNTESLFTKWRKTFTAMLVVFPVVSALFGACALAASIIGGIKSPGMDLVALGVATVPLLAAPALIKGSLAATGVVGSVLGNMSTKATGRLGDKVGKSSMLGAYKKAWGRKQEIKNAQIIGGTYRGKSPVGRMSSFINRQVNNSRLTGDLGNQVGAQAAHLSQKLEIENVEAAMAQIKQANLGKDALEAIGSGKKIDGLNGANIAMRSAAILQQLQNGDMEEAANSYNSTRDLKTDDRRVIANSIARSNDRPAFLGQGALAEYSQADKGKAVTFEQAAVAGVNSGAYSPAKMANADKHELDYVNTLRVQNATDIGGSTINNGVLRSVAQTALNEPSINKDIGKNRAVITVFSNLP